MNYKNTKEGFKYLFIASILMIVSEFSSLFNGTENQTLKVIGVIVALVGVVGFFMSLKGLKLCAQDDSGFNQAYLFALIGLVVGLIGSIISGIFKIEWLKHFTQTAINFCDFMIVWQVLTTSAYILDKKGNEQLAEKARGTSYLFLACFVVTLLFSYYQIDAANQLLLFAAGLIAVATAVIGIVGEVKYFLFVKEMKDAL